ncbi:MAG: transcription termination factor NusA [Acetobacteraceae bacterium]|nr:transcription termination factor NusA [Acetobacteraceae bacterium]
MNTEFMAALSQLEREKGISLDVLLEAIEAALISAYRRNFGSAQNVRVEIDRATGNIRVLADRVVVEAVEDPKAQVSLEEARRVEPNIAVGDLLTSEITPAEFGRIAAQTAKQVVVQRIREAERGIIFEEFSSREGDIVTGIVHRVEHRTVLIDLGKAEAFLPPPEQIPGEEYRQGERIKTHIVEVKKTTRGPQILVSRTHPGLLKRLFELEVPEIHDGVVEIRAVAREAGSRSKVAVWSRDPNVDPVGACVGPKGTRVQTVVSELKGEKVDVVRWDPDPAQFVANSLSPARVVRVETSEEGKVARVIVPDYQLSLAIGKEGQNARLAAKLTGWKIDIKSETQARLAAEAAQAQAQAAEAAAQGQAAEAAGHDRPAEAESHTPAAADQAETPQAGGAAAQPVPSAAVEGEARVAPAAPAGDAGGGPASAGPSEGAPTGAESPEAGPAERPSPAAKPGRVRRPRARKASEGEEEANPDADVRGVQAAPAEAGDAADREDA